MVWEAHKVVIRGHCMATTWGIRRQLLRDLSAAEQDVRQTEVQIAGQTASPSRLCQYRLRRSEAESNLGYHDFPTRMALQHAQGDRSGRLLAWHFRGEHRSAPAMVI
ncbi:hypothetical protein NDU88_009857 [Pleurodeles waltl]|uniref:Uncharacterized protein n=1 Tax=Pleurodeles waltl TaxID=8319 RepID=A0AAV7QSQ9_PLEWA|nr:hypothetical protein NDU88_009857 [Pleurodeles waltl]